MTGSTHRKLRVLVVMSQLRPASRVGGMGRVALGWARALVRRGHELHFTGPPSGLALEPQPDLTLHAWPSGGALVQLSSLIRVQRRIRADLIHFHSALPHGELIVPVRLLGGFVGDPALVVTPLTSARSDYPKLRARSGLRAADAIVTVSRWSADAAIRVGTPAEICTVVHAGIEVVPELGAKRLPVVVALGRLKHVKGFDVLIEAFDRAAAGRPDWRLKIGGDGEDRERLEAQARAARHGDRVELLGGVYGEAKQRLLGEASIGVVPSRAENFPGTLLEFQAHGLACIGTELGGIPELARGGAGALVPAGDAGALARRLAELMDDAELRGEMGRAARALAATLDWDRLGAQLERAYVGALERRHGAGRN
ncbi:MAG: glycosyltransferase family 4 protein [Deltaproteobacteria bacterium]|nr:glycosyltransferase family 4 protein [Deltaproteobacteria bacterium]